MELHTDSHTVVDAVRLNLTASEAKELAGLLAAVPVNTTSDTFDTIAEALAAALDYDVYVYEIDENGEYGPPKSGCGCGGGSDDDDEPSTVSEFVGSDAYIENAPASGPYEAEGNF